MPTSKAMGGGKTEATMVEICHLIASGAKSRTGILLEGEPGVGKAFQARSIHRISERRGPLFSVSCSGKEADLLEIELFGRPETTFGGSFSKTTGLIESANGGTLVLEEVGDLPSAIQQRLLTTTSPRPISWSSSSGEESSGFIDIRFIATTSRNLESDLKTGRFDRTLFSRLAGIHVVLPPLRRRRGDIPELVPIFIRDLCADFGRRELPSVTPAALQCLLDYVWPGNADELKEVLARALQLSGVTNNIDANHLTVEMQTNQMRESSTHFASSKAVFRCSLCGDVKDSAAKLISGPRVFICPVCVAEARRICTRPEGKAILADAASVARCSCSFCGRSAGGVAHLVAGIEALICDGCLDLCVGILEERQHRRRRLRRWAKRRMVVQSRWRRGVERQ